MGIEVRRLAKRFAGTPAVVDMSFRVPPGELVAVLGPSGSGKSTLLRLIAGLESPDAGEISLAGRDATFLPPRDRNVGFVFQHYALFRHMTVRENIAFGLDVRHVGRKDADARVAELLDLVQLNGMERRRPAQLSGGQRQRVAVARALAPRPSVLLLDEPFGALDARVREDLRRWIAELHERTHVTTLFVTHDQHEALEIAHRIFVMNKGRIEQEGTPVEIFDRPATPFVAGFVGENNFIEAEVSEPHGVRWGPFLFSVNGHPTGQRMNISFRPGDVAVSASARENTVQGRITRSRFKGATVELALNVGFGDQIIAHVPRRDVQSDDLTDGAEVHIGITAYNAFSQHGVEHADDPFHAVRAVQNINLPSMAVPWKA